MSKEYEMILSIGDLKAMTKAVKTRKLGRNINSKTAIFKVKVYDEDSLVEWFGKYREVGTSQVKRIEIL